MYPFFSCCRVTVRTSTRAHMFYIVNVSFLRIVCRVKKTTCSAFACRSHCLVIRVTLARRMYVHNVWTPYARTCPCDVCTLGFEKGLRCSIIVLFFANTKWQRVRIFNSLFFCRLHPLRGVGIKKKEKKNSVYRRRRFRIRAKFSDRSVEKSWKW